MLRLVLLFVLLAAPGAGGVTTASATAPLSQLDWTPCADAPDSQCTGLPVPLVTSSAVMPRGGAAGGPDARRTGAGAGKVARMVFPLNAPVRGVRSSAFLAMANSPGAWTVGRCA